MITICTGPSASPKGRESTPPRLPSTPGCCSPPFTRPGNASPSSRCGSRKPPGERPASIYRCAEPGECSTPDPSRFPAVPERGYGRLPRSRQGGVPPHASPPGDEAENHHPTPGLPSSTPEEVSFFYETSPLISKNLSLKSGDPWIRRNRILTILIESSNMRSHYHFPITCGGEVDLGKAVITNEAFDQTKANRMDRRHSAPLAFRLADLRSLQTGRRGGGRNAFRPGRKAGGRGERGTDGEGNRRGIR